MSRWMAKYLVILLVLAVAATFPALVAAQDECPAGTSGPDVLTATNCPAHFNGGAGNDSLTNNGDIGAKIIGGNGDDTLGNNGRTADDVEGGSGNDLIINSVTGHIGGVPGGSGNPDIEGLSGNDTIINCDDSPR